MYEENKTLITPFLYEISHLKLAYVIKSIYKRVRFKIMTFLMFITRKTYSIKFIENRSTVERRFLQQNLHTFAQKMADSQKNQRRNENRAKRIGKRPIKIMNQQRRKNDAGRTQSIGQNM